MFDQHARRRAKEAVLELRRRFGDQFARYEAGGVCLEPGWIRVLERLLERVREVDVVRRIGFSWLRIEEKYGELRLDWAVDCDRQAQGGAHNLVAAITAAVERAECESADTCQLCSNSGAPDDYNGWVMTVCDTHRALRRTAANDA